MSTTPTTTYHGILDAATADWDSLYGQEVMVRASDGVDYTGTLVNGETTITLVRGGAVTIPKAECLLVSVR